MSSAICFNLDQSTILSSVYRLYLYHTIASFNDPEEESCLNILREKKKKKTCERQFFPSPQCFLSLQNRIQIFESDLFYRLYFQSGEVKYFVLKKLNKQNSIFTNPYLVNNILFTI